ncbi:MAG TPA: nickel pincer cofactor biosynthesis protein LarB [Candidatus Nitrosopolaris sp.]|nr:nickel pincer cofactor biosynthesis protein LarB [Candidatus Nitrosopolaris sp.]
MDLKTILEKFAKGELALQDVYKQISIHSIEHVGNNLAKLDIGRDFRKGVPEVVFGDGKYTKDIIRIVLSAVKIKGRVVVSKIRRDELSKVCKTLRNKDLHIEVGKGSTTILVKANLDTKRPSGGKIGILSAGTSDIGIAEEARMVALAMDCDAITFYDVGIAGLHRLLPAMEEMLSADVGAIVVVAGMEGALASVVSSLVNVPVIGVPTSVGYGFGSAGIAALSCMLQSCALGLAVVNIDNGVGAGAFAALIANRIRISLSKQQHLESENTLKK